MSMLFAALAGAQPFPTSKVVMTTPKEALIGDTFTFCVTFENTGNAAGYAPFIDFVMPIGGADNNSSGGPCDGISFVSAQVISTTPNVPLTPELPLKPSGCSSLATAVTHDYPEVAPSLLLPAGGQLVTVPLPFGSFEPGQPKVFVEVTAKVHAFADQGTQLPIYVRGGFRYGANPGPGPAKVPTTAGPPAPGWDTQNVTPTVVILHKSYLGDDDEIAAGPNFTRTYEMKVDIAAGQPITGLVLDDCFAPGSGGVWVGSPTFTPPLPGGAMWGPFGPLCFRVTYPTITGNGPSTIKFTRNFMAQSGPPSQLTPPTVCSRPLQNVLALRSGIWTPLDPRDTPPVNWNAGPPLTKSVTIQKKALPIQKKTQLPAGGAIPGSVVTFLLPFQVSDYFRFGDLKIIDTMSDGLQLLPGSTLSVTDKFGSRTNLGISPAIPPQVVIGRFSCPPPADPCRPQGAIAGGNFPGSTRYTFDISARLQASGLSGVLTGGLAGGPNVPPATGVLTLKARVLDQFAHPSPLIVGDKFVDKDDPLFNHVEITSRQYKNPPAPLQPPQLQGPGCGDFSDSCFAVPGDVLEKKIVATKGNWLGTPANPLGGPLLQHGDTVTYKLSKTIPSGDAEKLTIRDWYPLPVLNAPTITSLPPCPIAQPPPAPPVACYNSGGPVPAIPHPDNSITFDFRTFNNPANAPRPIAVYTTHTITNAPFADGLLLTNEAEECEFNSYGTKFCQSAIAQFTLQEPNVHITKRACAINCQGLPPTCKNCGLLSIPAFATFNSAAGFGTTSVTADAGDTVTFYLVVENSGSGPDGAFDVTVSDSIGTMPGTIDYSKFCVRRGDGIPLTYTFSTQQPASFGLQLANLGLTQGSLASSSSTSGANIAVIVYEVHLNAAINVPFGCYSNNGKLVSYANSVGGPDFVSHGFPPATDTTASAEVCINPRDLQKSRIAVSETDPIAPKVAIGEIVRYELSFIVPEGTGTITVNENLPAGLEMLGGSADVSTVNWPSFALPATVPNSGTPAAPKFVFAPPLNAPLNGENDPDCERLVIRFNALVLNDPVNVDPLPKVNTFSIPLSTGSAVSPPVTVTIAEPKLSVTKTGSIDGGFASFDVVISNPIGGNTAFDVLLKETLPPACLRPLSVAALSVPNSGWSGNASLITITKVKAGETWKFRYTASLLCKDCVKLTNTVRVEWSSLPGPNGTTTNPTSASTPGPSGDKHGERNGSGTGSGYNIYSATATAGLCGKCSAQVCGTKQGPMNGVIGPLAGWTFIATALPPATGTFTSLPTPANGQFCITLPGPANYTIQEVQQPGWQQATPASTGYNVTIVCSPHQLNVGSHVPPGSFDFVNKSQCPVPCPPGYVCTNGICMPLQVPCGGGPPCNPPLTCKMRPNGTMQCLP
jgi:hypothetical protein